MNALELLNLLPHPVMLCRGSDQKWDCDCGGEYVFFELPNFDYSAMHYETAEAAIKACYDLYIIGKRGTVYGNEEETKELVQRIMRSKESDV